MKSANRFPSMRAERRSAVLYFAVQVMLSFATLWLLGSSASAQVTGQGTLSGTVTDPSGAVIVGAQVKTTNVATGVSYDTDTNSTGYFEVDHLNPGTYSISVSNPGFEKLLRPGVTLDADARLNVPVQLHPGATAQTVTINSDATLLNTESASSGQVLTSQQVQELTVSGSNPTWLALIAPGTQANVSQAASTGDGGGLIWVGQTQDFGNFGHIGRNEFNLDGAPNESNGEADGMNQAPDAVGEMKIDVTGYDASIGHTLGVNVTATTKGGTNQLHGAARWTYTDTRWAGLNSFQGQNYKYQQSLANCYNGAATSPTCYALENKYGNDGTNANNGDASIGGPVYIPKLMNGRNKKFFFFFSGIIDNFAGVGPATATVPTAAEQGGNFSDYSSVVNPSSVNGGQPWLFGDPNPSHVPALITNLCTAGTPYYGQYQLYNPYSVALDSKNVPRRTPFCGNTVPSNLLVNSAMTKFYNSVIPAPNSFNPGSANYVYTSLTPQTFRDYTTREDWKLTSKDDLFVRYSWQRYTKGTNSIFNVSGTDIGREAEARWIQLASIGWNHIINDHTNVSVSYGGTNFKNGCCYYPVLDTYNPTSLGLPSYTSNYATANAGSSGRLAELPVLSISSYSGIGQTDTVVNTTRSFALNGTVTHVMGRHTIRAGAEWRTQNNAQPLSGNISGTYTFNNTYTQENNGSDSSFAASNFALSYASFLMGIQASNSVAQNASYSFSSPFYGVYADDTWRVTPKLTIIPGLRFELEDGLTEKHNQLIVGWNPTASLPDISGPANAAYAATLASATPAALAVLPASLTIQGGPNFAGLNGNPRTQNANSYRFLPRFGATYQVNRRIIVRAGFGLYYDTMNALSPIIQQAGFSANTSDSTSSYYGAFGQTLTPGVSPLSNPFPANASGANFNAPVGSSASAEYYAAAGGSPTIVDHNTTPAREYRGSIGTQIQFGASTMLDVSFNIARTTHSLLGKNNAYTPQSFYSSAMAPNNATATFLNQQVSNPFYYGNFSGLAGSNPAVYNLLSHNQTSKTLSVGTFVRAYPQMGGLTISEPVGQSDFQEILLTLTHRWSHGLSLTGSFEINDQHDADYFANAYDSAPSWEPSNSSEPTRLTVEEVWALPFGRGNKWASHGWENAVFGGFKINSAYEAQPGTLIGFGNLFYVGDPKGSAIKIKHPIFHMNNLITNGTANYIQWLNPGTATATSSCAYSGVGFITSSSCQPNAYNTRVFPTRINGVRNMGMNNVDGNIARTFHIRERLNFETSFLVYNVFNHQGYGSANASPTSAQFGQVTGDGFPQAGSRWLSLQGRLTF